MHFFFAAVMIGLFVDVPSFATVLLVRRVLIRSFAEIVVITLDSSVVLIILSCCILLSGRGGGGMGTLVLGGLGQ